MSTVTRPPHRSAPPLDVVVHGIGLIGPGLPSWRDAQALLHNATSWVHGMTAVPPPARLPATERRRAGTVVKASIVVADEAIAAASADAALLATVFTSSTGDPVNCHLLCEALATVDRMVSPTRFTNSVHNAAAGYWHIAAASRAPSTSLAAFDASFAAGLLEAAVQVRCTAAPVLLVACDVPYPEPLHAVRPVLDTFAVALLLAPTGDGARLRIRLVNADGDADVDADADALASITRCEHAGLEALRIGIPSARALPLLEALARAESHSAIVLEALPGAALVVDVSTP